MKILFVDDNRDVNNWGCRATSISLSQILEKEFTIDNIIGKRTVDTPISLGLSLLEKGRLKILRKLLLRVFFNKPLIQNIFDIQRDFIVPDPSASVSNLVEHKDRNPLLHSIYEKVRTADAVVINGEGSMIFTTPPRRDLLFQLMIIELAADHFRKPVFYLNAMMSDCPVHGRNQETAGTAINSLKKCQHVAFRDHQSFNLASAISNDLKCSYVPDALFSWFDCFQNTHQQIPFNGEFILPFPRDGKLYGKLDFHAPYVCVGGSSLAARNIGSAIPAYCTLVENLRRLGINIYLVQTCDGDHFLHNVSILTGVPIIPVNMPILMGGAILANARLFVSGRFHPSILASLGGTPCLFLGSNSHKTRSLQEVLEYDTVREWPAIPTKEDCYEILHMAHNVLGAGEELRGRIKSASKKRSVETGKLLKIIQNGCMFPDQLMISSSAVYNGSYDDNKRNKPDI